MWGTNASVDPHVLFQNHLSEFDKVWWAVCTSNTYVSATDCGPYWSNIPYCNYLVTKLLLLCLYSDLIKVSHADCITCRALCTCWAEWTLQRNILLPFRKRLLLCAVHFEGYFSGVKVAGAWGSCHLHLPSKLGTSGAIHLILLHTIMAYTEKHNAMTLHPERLHRAGFHEWCEQYWSHSCKIVNIVSKLTSRVVNWSTQRHSIL
jgi:hypothetical protein